MQALGLRGERCCLKHPPSITYRPFGMQPVHDAPMLISTGFSSVKISSIG
jgi:hypothetical protein